MDIRKYNADIYAHERDAIPALWLYCQGIPTAPDELADELNQMVCGQCHNQGLVIEGHAPDWAILMLTAHYGRGFSWVGRYDYNSGFVVVIDTKESINVPVGRVFPHWSKY